MRAARGAPVETAPGMTRVRLLGQTRLTVRDSYDVSLDGLIVEAGCDSGSGASTTKVQSRHLLVADFGVWTGFVGLIAIVAADETFPKTLGAVALICGLAIALVGLDRVVRDRPACRPPAGLSLASRSTTIEKVEFRRRVVIGPVPSITIRQGSIEQGV